jgi:TatA/E family protein of Tat protein translocase
MPNIGAPELIIILVIALLILGPGKLPEVGASLGKSIREFRKASTDLQDSAKVDIDTTPLPTDAPPAAPAASAVTSPVAAAAPIAPATATPASVDAPATPTPPAPTSAGPTSDSSTVAS